MPPYLTSIIIQFQWYHVLCISIKPIPKIGRERNNTTKDKKLDVVCHLMLFVLLLELQVYLVICIINVCIKY